MYVDKLLNDCSNDGSLPETDPSFHNIKISEHKVRRVVSNRHRALRIRQSIGSVLPDPNYPIETPYADPGTSALFGTDLSKGGGPNVNTSHLLQSKHVKSELAAAIVVLIVVAALGIFALWHYKHRKRSKNQKSNISRAQPTVTEGIDPGETGKFRIRREMRMEMQQPDRFRPQYASAPQRHRHELQNQNSGRFERRPIGSTRQKEPPLPAFTMTAAKERYYGNRSQSKLSTSVKNKN